MTFCVVCGENLAKTNLDVGDVQVDFRGPITMFTFGTMFMYAGLFCALSGRFPRAMASIVRVIYLIIPVVGVTYGQGTPYN